MRHLLKWLTLACFGLAFSPTLVNAQHFEQGLQDPRLISPAGLGPSYSGLNGAGVGLLSRKPLYGVEAGDFILQPRFFLEGSFRTNFFRIDERNGGTPEGVFTLHVRPGVAFFNPQYDKIALSLALDVNAFLPFGEQAVTDQTTVGGKARVGVALFPKSAFTITLYDEFERSLWMRPQIFQNANRNRNEVGVDLSLHPGGKALDFTLGYAYELQRFDDLNELDTDAHKFRGLFSWRFYPMTYAFLEGEFRTFEYRREATDPEVSAVGNYVPGTPLKVYAGLSGYITERFALLVRAGYGNSLLERAPDDFSSFIGQLQLSYRFSAKTVLHAGIARDFEMAPLGGYMDYIRPYATFTQRIGEIADLNIDFSYDIRSYGEWDPSSVGLGGAPLGTVTASSANREENYLRVGAVLDFHVSRIFGVTAGYRFDSLISDYTLQNAQATTFTGYDDHRIFASLNLRY